MTSALDPAAVHVATTTAPDGRRLAHAEFGDPAGRPAIYFHGSSTCHLDGVFFDAAARAAGVRVVAVDRPGSGDSDPHPGRSLTDWPADVTVVADALGIDEYVVTGMSGGGPHALACAATGDPRVLGAVPVNSATPNDPQWLRDAPAPMRLTPFFLRNAPAIGTRLLRAMGKASGRQNLSLRTMPRDWREVFADEEILATFLVARERGLAQDRAVWTHEGTLFWDPSGWGFDPAGLPVPVIGCSGVLDPSTTFTRHVVDTAMPGSRFVELPGGHVHPLLPDAAAMVMDAVASLST